MFFNVHAIFVCDFAHIFVQKSTWLLLVICGTLCDGVRPHKWTDFMHICFLSTSVQVWPHWSKLEVPKVGEYAITIRPQINKQTTFLKNRGRNKKKGFSEPSTTECFFFGSGELYKNNPGHILVVHSISDFFFFLSPPNFNIFRAPQWAEFPSQLSAAQLFLWWA